MTRECTVHHHACDCREAKFAEIEGERDALKIEVDEVESVIEDLDQENMALRKVLEEAKGALIGEVDVEGPCTAKEVANRIVDCIQALKADRDELERELHEMRAKVSQWAVNHAWMLEEVEPREDIEKINRVISPPEGISISEWCKRTHIQLCHCCDDLTCDDNLRKEIKEKENEPKR
jgi:chromosome segregation ATPase